jgi:hypothetical protein
MLERYRSKERATPSTPMARRLHAQTLRARFNRQIADEEKRRQRAEELRRRFQRGML